MLFEPLLTKSSTGLKMPQREFISAEYELAPATVSTISASIQFQSEVTQWPVDFSFEVIKRGLFKATFTSNRIPCHRAFDGPGIALYTQYHSGSLA